MAIIKSDITRRNTDNRGNLTVTYVVTSDGSDDVESIQYAYIQGTTERLPQIGEVNTLRSRLGSDITNNRQTYVDSVSVAHDGSDYNTYKITVSYKPPSESKESKDHSSGPVLPWNEPTDVSQSGDVIMERLRGLDALGRRAKYSNGASMQIERPVPITIYTLTRKVHRKSYNSFDLSKQYFQKVNDKAFTFLGVEYNPWELLVQAFDVNLDRFKLTNENTGRVTVEDYYVESVVIAANPRTWKEFVLDEGNYAFKEVKDADEVVKNVLTPGMGSKTTGRSAIITVDLNGAGKPIRDEEGNHLNDALVNTPTPISDKTTLINNELSEADGPDAQTVFEVLTFETVDFKGMALDDGVYNSTPYSGNNVLSGEKF